MLDVQGLEEIAKQEPLPMLAQQLPACHYQNPPVPPATFPPNEMMYSYTTSVPAPDLAPSCSFTSTTSAPASSSPPSEAYSPASDTSLDECSSPPSEPSRKRKRPAEDEDTTYTGSSFVWRTYNHAEAVQLYYTGGRDMNPVPLDPYIDVQVHGKLDLCPQRGTWIAYRRNRLQFTYKWHADIPRGSAFCIQDRTGVFRSIKSFRVQLHAVKTSDQWSGPPLTDGASRVILTPEGKARVVETAESERLPPYLEVPILPTGAQAKLKSVYFGSSTNLRTRQRVFFKLIVVLCGVDDAGIVHAVHGTMSDPIIVRASNPGSYKAGSQPKTGVPCADAWVVAAPSSCQDTAQSEFDSMDSARILTTKGKVGINTNTPTEALSVSGNVQVTGTMYRPSDRRIKSNLQPVSKRSQLHTIRQLNVYDYTKEDPGTGEITQERGVIAQQVQQIAPTAVKVVPKVVSTTGKEIENLLVVDDRHLLMETIGATQELDRRLEHIDDRVVDLEFIEQVKQKEQRKTARIYAEQALPVYKYLFVSKRGRSMCGMVSTCALILAISVICVCVSLIRFGAFNQECACGVSQVYSVAGDGSCHCAICPTFSHPDQTEDSQKCKLCDIANPTSVDATLQRHTTPKPPGTRKPANLTGNCAACPSGSTTHPVLPGECVFQNQLNDLWYDFSDVVSATKTKTGLISAHKDGYTYYINPCGPTFDAGCSNTAVVCQTSEVLGSSRALASADSSVCVTPYRPDINEDGISITYTSREVCGEYPGLTRTTTLNFECDASIVVGAEVTSVRTVLEGCIFTFDVRSAAACGSRVAPS